MTSKRWLLCLLACVASQSLAADRAWRMATTPDYRLFSQADERATAAWMRGFDQFILSTSDVLKMELRALPPLTVVIFDSDEDYAPYKLLRPNGETANVAGQFSRYPAWSVIGMAHGADDARVRMTIHHEATHWLMSVDQTRQPAWFTEGIAELFSTFERRGDKVNWAKPIGPHLQLLNQSGEIPLKQFLAEPSALFDRDDRTGRFYAQAWAFTHFMLLSQDARYRPLMIKFLEAYKTQSGEAAVDAVFGPVMKDIEREFRLYTNRRSYGYIIEPVKPAADPPPLQPAPAALVEAALGFLALGADRLDLAQRHAEKAVELEKDSPEGYTLLTYVAVEKEDYDKAATHAEAALQRGSKDSELFIQLGNSYADGGSNSQKPDAKQERVNLYEKAINLNPRRLEAYHRLTDALYFLDKPREEEAKFLQLGLQAFPGEDFIRVGVAIVDYRLGRRELAKTTLESVLRPESRLDARQRDNAMNLKRTWLAEQVNSELRAAISKQDFKEARAVVRRYRERLGEKDEAFNAFLTESDARMEIGELMAQYEQLRRANKMKEARAAAEQLLARPNLPAEFRKFLQERLSEAK
jgi:tetratricopeptide (TPR) repeat protein